MSGHSKWHNIRLRKGKQDAERGKLFTRVAREIIVAAKEGGGNPDANLRLKMAMQKARDVHMPQDNIKRAIMRGTGELDGSNYDEVTYEGYGPAGVAILVECMTDNKNRTVSEIRHAFTKAGGSLGEMGCVGWMFTPQGMIIVPLSAGDEETIMTAALEAGAEDFVATDDGYEITTDQGGLNTVTEALKAAGIPVENSEPTMTPSSTVAIEGKEAQQVLRLLDMLDELDDVQAVHSNADIPDDEYEG